MAVVAAVEVVDTAEAAEVGAVAVAVGHVDPEVEAGAGVTAAVGAVVVVMVVAAEVTPVAVAACLAKAIPRAAVTNKLFALQHGV